MPCSRLALLVLLMMSAARALKGLPTLFAAQRRLGAETGDSSATPPQSPSASLILGMAAAVLGMETCHRDSRRAAGGKVVRWVRMEERRASVRKPETC